MDVVSGTDPTSRQQILDVSRAAREAEHRHLAGVVWLTGLPGSGKTTLSRLVESRLFASGHRVARLDGDELRHGLSADLGFTPVDRAENIRRAGEVARLFFENGTIVLCAFVSPYREDRERARSLLPADRFVEVFVNAAVGTCRQRDPKGLYHRAAAGDVTQFTGLTAPYQEPLPPDLTIDTERCAPDEGADRILDCL